MKRLLLLFMHVSVIACLADEYKDPVSNVIYTYEPTGYRAEVKCGMYYMFDGGDYDVIAVPGSPDAKTEIIILDKFTIDEKEYTVDKIGSCAFLLKDNIVSVTIPSSINTIDSNAFFGCINLSEIIIDKGLVTIGTHAFCGCKSLTNVLLPEGLKIIKNGVFKDTGLTSITIPSTVQSIGDAAFYSSTISTITSLIEEPFKVSQLCQQQNEISLLVPAGSKSKYEITSSWNQFQKIEEIQPTAIMLPTCVHQAFCYNLSGRRMFKLQSSMFNGLRKGIYIQDGKKVAIK